MFQVGTEKITVYHINLLKVQKNWFVILFQVDSTYIKSLFKYFLCDLYLNYVAASPKTHVPVTAAIMRFNLNPCYTA